MKGRSLRAAYLGAIAATLCVLAAEPATAHLSVRPGVVTAGESVRLLVELPDVGGPAPTSIVLEGAGIETLSSETAPGAPARESRWSVRVRVEAPAGPLPTEIRVAYPGGNSFTLATTLTVVPGDGSGDVLVLGVGSGVFLALAALWLVRRRA